MFLSHQQLWEPGNSLWHLVKIISRSIWNSIQKYLIDQGYLLLQFAIQILSFHPVQDFKYMQTDFKKNLLKDHEIWIFCHKVIFITLEPAVRSSVLL